MRFPVELHQDDGQVSVTFPDIPEAFSNGKDQEDALRHAVDALETALDFYFDDKRPVPTPSEPSQGQKTVTLPASVAATVLLHNEMLAQRVRPSELASRMGIRKQEVTRIISRRHPTKIDTLERAFKMLGRSLDLTLSR